MRFSYLETPIGRLLLAGDEVGLRHIAFAASPQVVPKEWVLDPPWFAEASRQLLSYFAGGLRALDLPLAPEGTPFQRRVWAAVRAISYGNTVTYAELAG